ncbi:hypothetical protein AC578_2979 [Pseudocercospora eumusae]|uniref:Uncharacterized protein n=1 Tax=Pseudocercospora eumusae TaxID=321146 RepID=A0A139HEA7_9PEZI|nr:hypothetical protein AC578_2979 [Pseudocercospora eumusae]
MHAVPRAQAEVGEVALGTFCGKQPRPQTHSVKSPRTSYSCSCACQAGSTIVNAFRSDHEDIPSESPMLGTDHYGRLTLAPAVVER